MPQSNSAVGEARFELRTDAQPGRCSSPRRAERRLSTWQSYSDAGAPARVKAVPARRPRARLGVGERSSARSVVVATLDQHRPPARITASITALALFSA